jgi:hypothetical protein
MKRVFLISPYSGDVERNLKYADKCQTFCFSSGLAPFAGHILYPRVLDDNIEKDRDFGMRSAYAWLSVADMAVAFMDLGVSRGMRADLDAARRLSVPIQYLSLNGSPILVDPIHNLKLPHAHMPCALCQIEIEQQSHNTQGNSK